MFRETPGDRVREIRVSESFYKEHGDEVRALCERAEEAHRSAAGNTAAGRVSEHKAADRASAKSAEIENAGRTAGAGRKTSDRADGKTTGKESAGRASGHVAGYRLPVEILPDTRFKSLSDTQTPQGILAVVEKCRWEAADILSGPAPFILILENLQDPGNVGTIIRTAEAAGVDGIFYTKGCVDLYNPKTIRSTMGAVYRMPHAEIDDMDGFLKMLADRRITTYASSLATDKTYLDRDYRTGTALMIGNEGNGLSPELQAAADALIHIPMHGQVESLNAAMAAGILMYEVCRQRM
ncbi:MAG: RNA methyltransferase [Lachnospiraceae bacterium]|nr:RNA methyltransferase [Lachnospiraceae bacterium]